MNSVLEIEDELPDVPVFVMGKTQSDLLPRYLSYDDVMIRALPVPVCRTARSHIKPNSPLCFIYTSGTTGAVHLCSKYILLVLILVQKSQFTLH